MIRESRTIVSDCAVNVFRHFCHSVPLISDLAPQALTQNEPPIHVCKGDTPQNLFEQVSAVLSQLDADARAKLSADLSKHSKEASDFQVAQSVQEVLPDSFKVEFLTPTEWGEKRDQLLNECKTTARTLFLIDQELDQDDGAGASKGTQIISSMHAADAQAFGTRWFCGILTHTVEKDAEVSRWRQISDAEGLALELFMPISKQNLAGQRAFYTAVHRTLLNVYTEKMKNLAKDAFKRALESSLKAFTDLDPIDFEHIVVKSSKGEGVSEFETITRLHSLFQRDEVKKELLHEDRLPRFLDAAKSANLIANVDRQLPETSSERLRQLMSTERYESGDLVNKFHDPIRNGDVFEIEVGSGKSLWVLVAQPCDIMVRKDGKRAYENNFKVAVLAPVIIDGPENIAATVSGHVFPLENMHFGDAHSGFVKFAKATPVNLAVLDLAVLRDDGLCEIDALNPLNDVNFASLSWEKRARRLWNDCAELAKEIEAVREQDGDGRANEISEQRMLRLIPAVAFDDCCSYDKGKFTYKARRCGHIREPLATNLLAAFSRYLSRDAYEHDFAEG